MKRTTACQLQDDLLHFLLLLPAQADRPSQPCENTGFRARIPKEGSTLGAALLPSLARTPDQIPHFSMGRPLSLRLRYLAQFLLTALLGYALHHHFVPGDHGIGIWSLMLNTGIT